MNSPSARLDYLDATRAFALLLGIVFHASLSFLPFFMGWAVQDVSTSMLVAVFITVSHSFRMELFFLLAGFFGCVTLQRKTVGEFVRSRATRILVPFVVGWFVLRPLLVSGWHMGAASLRGDYDFWAGIVGGFASMQTLPAGLFTGSHLWFLYYLALITGLALAVRALLASTGAWGNVIARRADVATAWLARSPLAVPLFAVATAGALWFMQTWGMDTPDKSLVPHVPVLLVYSGFFGLGWLLARQRELITTMTTLSAGRWVMAGLGSVGTLMLAGVQANPSHPNYTLAHVGYVLSYALMMWSLVFLTLGLFQKWFAQPRGWVRYLADSSYWMYLVHLPIVVWLQVAVAEIPAHWSIKLLSISAVTIAISLLTYDLFVRPTFVGVVLNGRRQSPALESLLNRRRAICESPAAS